MTYLNDDHYKITARGAVTMHRPGSQIHNSFHIKLKFINQQIKKWTRFTNCLGTNIKTENPIKTTKKQQFFQNFSTFPRAIQAHVISNAISPLTFDKIHIDRALGMIPLCFPRRGASPDIQPDLLWPLRDLTWPELNLRSNFDLCLLISTCMCLNMSRREQHDGFPFSPYIPL